MNAKTTEIASKEDYLATFPDGVRAAEQYYEAMGLVKQGQSYSKISKQVKKDPTTILRWVQGRQPPSVRSLEGICEKGLVPLDIANPLFPALNVFAAKVHWTGTLGKCNPCAYSIGICGARDSLEDLASFLESELPLQTKIRVADDRYQLTLRNHTEYARLLMAMGCKTYNGDPGLPEYIDRLVDMKPSQGSPEHKALTEFAQVLFEERFTIQHDRRNRNYRLYLHGCNSTALAARYSKKVLRLLNSAFPLLNITEDNMLKPRKIADNRKRSYIPSISLKKQGLLELLTHYPQLINLGKPKVRRGKDVSEDSDEEAA
jgi:transcriptional regulator with XRE-family HTH domain